MTSTRRIDGTRFHKGSPMASVMTFPRRPMAPPGNMNGSKEAMKQIRAADWYDAAKPPTVKESPHSRGIFGLGR